MRQEKSSNLIIPLVYSESIFFFFFKAFGVSEVVNFEGKEVCNDIESSSYGRMLSWFK